MPIAFVVGLPENTAALIFCKPSIGMPNIWYYNDKKLKHTGLSLVESGLIIHAVNKNTVGKYSCYTKGGRNVASTVIQMTGMATSMFHAICYIFSDEFI